MHYFRINKENTPLNFLTFCYKFIQYRCIKPRILILGSTLLGIIRGVAPEEKLVKIEHWMSSLLKKLGDMSFVHERIYAHLHNS